MYKVVFLITIVLITNTCLYAQNKERLSRAYIGAQLHEDQPGFTLTNSFGINKFFGIGAGADLTSYDSQILVPVYLDVRGRYQINKWEPFVLGQFGKNLYKKNDAIIFTDITGQGFTYDKNGQFFYGVGIGTSYSVGKVAIFISYIYRSYKYDYGQAKVSSAPSLPNEIVNANIISAGLAF